MGQTLEQKHKNAQLKLETAQMNKMSSMFEQQTFAQTRDKDDDFWSVVGKDPRNKQFTEEQNTRMYIQAQKLQYTTSGRNVLQTMNDFIIGKNAYFDSLDQDERVQEYWDDWVKAAKWDLRSKEYLRRTVRDGECFQRMFGMGQKEFEFLQPRFIDPPEIKAGTKGARFSFGVRTDPDDVELALAYNRVYLQGTTTIEEEIAADEIIHTKIGVDANVKRGISFFNGIAKYMKEYELWLEDRILINKARHIWNVIGKVDSSSTNDLKAQFKDIPATAGSGNDPAKKVPNTSGGVFLTRGVEWELKNLNIRAQDTKDDGRLIQLMVAMGTGFPEYIARADASNSNMASTMISESPFVRAMESWQDFIEKPWHQVYEMVINHGMLIGKVPKKTVFTTQSYDIKKKEPVETKAEGPTNTEADINFATLIHREYDKDTKAFMTQYKGGLISRRTAQEKLGHDPEIEDERIAQELDEEFERAKLEQGFKDDNDDNNFNNDGNDD